MDRAWAERLLSRLHAAQNAMYAGGDSDPVRRVLTGDIEWNVPGDNAIGGCYRGHDQVLAYFERRRGIAENTLRLHPGELLTGHGDHVAVLTDGSASIGGVEHRWSTVGLYRFRHERISHCWLLALDQAAFDRAWSPARLTGEVHGGVGVAIRAAEADDVPAVLSLWDRARSAAAVSRDDAAGVRSLIDQPGSTLLVAEREDEIVGSLIAAWDGWRGNVYRLAVSPELRRHGIARRLVEEGHERLRAAGARRVTALVGADDVPAAALWASVGYARDEGVARYVRNL